MRSLRDEIAMMLTQRDYAASHKRHGHPVQAAYCAEAASNAEARARAMIREMHDIPDPPPAAEWLTDDELGDEMLSLEAAGETGSARWCDLDAEAVLRFLRAA